MANTKREKLFTEFPPVPTEKWEEVITADLKGADYERKLVWRTGEGFNVRPYAPKTSKASVFWARRQASSRTSEVRAATIAGACIRPSR